MKDLDFWVKIAPLIAVAAFIWMLVEGGMKI